MIYRFALAAAFLVPAFAASAEELTHKPDVKPGTFDLSRSITLTGNEIQALMRAASLQAQAQAALQAATEIDAKFRAAMTVPGFEADRPELSKP